MNYIVNLNAPILCPYQMVLDISKQISPSPSNINKRVFEPICELNATDDWINLESLGKPVAIRAKTLCDTVTPLLINQNGMTLSLDIYNDHSPLASDNLFCLIYLAQAFNTIELTFHTTADNLTRLQASTTYLSTLPNCALHFKTDSPSDINQDMLAQLNFARQQTIKSIGFTLDDNTLNDGIISENTVNQLIGFAWMCLKSGAYDIACQLLEKAQRATTLNPLMQEQLFMHLLMIRFFSHQYALVTQMEFPKECKHLTEAELKKLQFLKAYSATLSRNLPIAKACFIQCGIDENLPLTDENSLYQLNLYALSKVLEGNTDTAVTLEFRIKDFIEAQHINTAALKYVNYINIARLYKKTKHFDASFDYYKKAYREISGGGYSTSDHIYYNMNLGSLSEAAGNTENALMYWLKAAMHWLACTNKYELSWRPRLILCSETLNDISKPLPVDKANAFLLDKIKTLIQMCEIELNPKSPIHQFSDDRLSPKKEHCFIKNNIVLFTGQLEPSVSPKNVSPTEQQLSTFISQYLHSVMDIPHQARVLIMDTQLEMCLLNTVDEAIAFAKASDCSACYFNGDWLALDNSKPMKVSLSKLIKDLNQTEKGLLVQFKRSFLNKMLSDKQEIDFVNKLKQDDFLCTDQFTDTSRAILNQLAKKRMLHFSY